MNTTPKAKEVKGTITNAFIINTKNGKVYFGEWGADHTIKTSLVVNEYIRDGVHYAETLNSIYIIEI